MHLENLLAIIEAKKATQPYACIRDLVSNGLCLDRYPDDDTKKANRHEVTLFLAAWCRRAGLEPDDYRDWLVNYSTEVLAAISSTALSQIRHSTKSTIKFIHRSEVPFVCKCEDNIFKAACSADCPAYKEMRECYMRLLDEEQQKVDKLQKITEDAAKERAALPPPKQTTTQKYKKQYEESLLLIKQHLDDGYTKKAITKILNDKGYKTTIGNQWTAHNLSGCCGKYGWYVKRKRKEKRSTAR